MQSLPYKPTNRPNKLCHIRAPASRRQAIRTHLTQYAANTQEPAARHTAHVGCQSHCLLCVNCLLSSLMTNDAANTILEPITCICHISYFTKSFYRNVIFQYNRYGGHSIPINQLICTEIQQTLDRIPRGCNLR